ncbi:hypothetical protein F5Y10DRAFT_243288 [Nemania abortiva]|nr:hypothetical protein F5Y10DRAFT_243288 [Nemania abortiva]
MAQSRKPPPNPRSVSSTTAANPSPATGLKQRRPGPASKGTDSKTTTRQEEGYTDATMPWATRNQWIVYAVASGACAAFNGVFAKLTTNDLTGHIARGISGILGLQGIDKVLEIIVRCIFFGLNLFFNGVMWTLFTQALAKGTSTTQVSIMNTSTNFMITALLGFAIFAEALPPLWWVGATLLVAGNVVIGRKDEGSADDTAVERSGEEEEAAERGSVGIVDPEFKDDEDIPLIGNLDDPPHDR